MRAMYTGSYLHVFNSKKETALTALNITLSCMQAYHNVELKVSLGSE